MFPHKRVVTTTTKHVRFASSISSGSKKKKATNPRMELHRFLGPKNFKGLYYRNPLAYTPDYAKYSKQTNYITSYPIQQLDRAGPSVKWDQVFKSGENRRQYSRTIDPLKPFADNPHCKSALLIGDSLKQSIINDHKNGLSTQRISFKYQIALPRIEAVVKLNSIEQKYLSEVSITALWLNDELKKIRLVLKTIIMVRKFLYSDKLKNV